MELSLLTVIVVGAITIGLVKAFALLHHQYTYWKKRNVPHLSSAPLLGTGWKMFFGRLKFYEYCLFVYNSFPNVRYFGTMDLTNPALMIRDPELIKEIGVKNFEHFMDHRIFSDEQMDPVFGKNIFVLRGERWREMRTTLSPSFTASKMRFLFEVVAKCSRDFVDYLYDHPEFSSSMEMKDAFTRYTNDVIATAAFGINVNSMQDRNNEFFERGRDIANFASIWTVLKFIMFRACPRLTRMSGISIFSKRDTNFFRKIISETIKLREEKGIVRPDMIHLLMEAREKEKLTTHHLSNDDIVAQAFIFFLAGFDTSSTLMCFMAYELSINPDIQEKLRKEVDRHLNEGNGDITYETLSKMEYMDMVISETLRKYPAVIFLDRLCTKKFELPPAADGYDSVTVDVGTSIWIPAYAMQHDPQYFPNPEKFDPERFSEENKDNIIPYSYIPFGVGPRKCIGNRFAYMETKILLAHLLHKFYLKPAERMKIPLVFSRAFALKAEGGIWVSLEKRNT